MTTERQTIDQLCNRLRQGAAADIWFDAQTFDDPDAAQAIEDAQDAMREAAEMLEKTITP